MSRVPAFVSRVFRHTSIYVRTDRIKKPEDLKGKKVGVPEYQLTANVWARAFLEDDYGVKPFRHPLDSRRHRARRAAGKDHHQAAARRAARQRAGGRDDFEMLEAGEIDGFMAPRPPTLMREATIRNIGWLFPDPVAVAKDYFKRTGIFPIMHLIGMRRDARREASVAAGRGAQGVRAIEGRRRWRSCPTPRRPR